jgi:hypothetical protein
VWHAFSLERDRGRPFRGEGIRQQVVGKAVNETRGCRKVALSIGDSSLTPKDHGPDMFVAPADRARIISRVTSGKQMALVDRGRERV